MNLNETIGFLKSKSRITPKIGFILGSGLGDFAQNIENAVSIPFPHIPHFKNPSVEGHSGELIFGNIGKTPVVALKGRVHFYEGHSLEEVVYPIRVLVKLGITTLVVTNSAGGLKKTMKPGELMVITDHINLTGQNPLIGPNHSSLGPRFPDMSEAYDKKLSKKLLSLLKKFKIRSSHGVYCGVTGPSYETPAEVRYLRKIGGSAVGMSTVFEVITAKHMGLRVLGISCITNLASGILNQPLNHEEVTLNAGLAQKNFSKVLLAFAKTLP